MQEEFPVIEPSDRFPLNFQNPYTKYIEETIPSIATEANKFYNFTKVSSASIQDKMLTPELKQIMKDSIGKYDGYTDMRGQAHIREYLRDKINKFLETSASKLGVKEQDLRKITENDVIATFGLESAFYLVLTTLLENGDSILIPKVKHPFLNSLIASRKGKQVTYSTYDEILNCKENVSAILVYHPCLFSKEQSAAVEQVDKLLTMAKEKTLPLIVLGEKAEEFMERNTKIDANIIVIREQDAHFKGWRSTYMTLIGGGFKDVLLGLQNVLNIILMTNTISQQAFVELDKALETQKTGQFVNQNIQAHVGKISGFRQEQEYGVFCLKQSGFVNSDEEFCLYMYQKYGIILIPGSYYGAANQIIFNLEQEDEALQYLATSIQEAFNQE